jgi:uncharacterized membrane protein
VKSFVNLLPKLSLFAFIALMISMGVSSLNITTTSMIVVSFVMLCSCYLSAAHLLGLKKATLFFIISMIIGFIAEVVGTKTGWVFGGYYFTDVLTPQILGVPIVIPIMWFNLIYICYVIANLIIWRAPLDYSKSKLNHFLMAFLVAMLVTAYDLAADPYMVYVVKAWIMTETDGWWFGQTLHGFVGWIAVSFLITILFRVLTTKSLDSIPSTFTKWHALIPVSIFACWMIFQMLYGFPVETRTISAFAMGTPLLITFIGMQNWNWVK